MVTMLAILTLSTLIHTSTSLHFHPELGCTTQHNIEHSPVGEESQIQITDLTTTHTKETIITLLNRQHDINTEMMNNYVIVDHQTDNYLVSVEESTCSLHNMKHPSILQAHKLVYSTGASNYVISTQSWIQNNDGNISCNLQNNVKLGQNCMDKIKELFSDYKLPAKGVPTIKSFIIVDQKQQQIVFSETQYTHICQLSKEEHQARKLIQSIQKDKLNFIHAAIKNIIHRTLVIFNDIEMDNVRVTMTNTNKDYNEFTNMNSIKAITLCHHQLYGTNNNNQRQILMDKEQRMLTLSMYNIFKHANSTYNTDNLQIVDSCQQNRQTRGIMDSIFGGTNVQDLVAKYNSLANNINGMSANIKIQQGNEILLDKKMLAIRNNLRGFKLSLKRENEFMRDHFTKINSIIDNIRMSTMMTSVAHSIEESNLELKFLILNNLIEMQKYSTAKTLIYSNSSPLNARIKILSAKFQQTTWTLKMQRFQSSTVIKTKCCPVIKDQNTYIYNIPHEITLKDKCYTYNQNNDNCLTNGYDCFKHLPLVDHCSTFKNRYTDMQDVCVLQIPTGHTYLYVKGNGILCVNNTECKVVKTSVLQTKPQMTLKKGENIYSLHTEVTIQKDLKEFILQSWIINTQFNISANVVQELLEADHSSIPNITKLLKKKVKDYIKLNDLNDSMTYEPNFMQKIYNTVIGVGMIIIIITSMICCVKFTTCTSAACWPSLYNCCPSCCRRRALTSSHQQRQSNQDQETTSFINQPPSIQTHFDQLEKQQQQYPQQPSTNPATYPNLAQLQPTSPPNYLETVPQTSTQYTYQTRQTPQDRPQQTPKIVTTSTRPTDTQDNIEVADLEHFSIK